jgi:hypothetical protein
MSIETSLAVASLAAAAALALALVRTRRRLARVEARARRLEDLVSTELEPGIAAARQDARAATTVARDAAAAAGVAPASPRLPFEPVTGPVLRAVAVGASARRALARVAAPPRGRSRRLPRSA